MTFIDENRSKLSRRSFLGASLGASAFGVFCLPKTFAASFGADSDARGNDVVLRFAAMSDVHIDGEPDGKEPKRFARALQVVREYAATQPYKRFDALVVAGDFSNNGSDKEFELFRKIMVEGLAPETTPILCMGNHDCWGGADSRARWEKTFGVPANCRYEVGGFQFVALSPEKGTMEDGDYLYALDWFDQELAAASAADPKKPIFVLQHYHVTPTVLGTLDGDIGGTRDLYETLAKYPRVVDFSGHSHRPLCDPRSAWQGEFAAFGTSTLSYFCMSSENGKYDKMPARCGEGAEFYIVEVRRDNSVTLKPYDLRTDSFYDFVYFVAEPGAIEKNVYTKARWGASAKPIWPDGANATFAEATFDGAVFHFPQATCPDFVHSYRVELERRGVDSNGDALWEPVGAQYFWSEYYFRDAPKRMKIALSGLDERTAYRGKIFALNPYFKEGDAALKIEFETAKDPFETVDKNAAAPDANLLDLRFVDGKGINAPKNALPKQKEIQTLGAPKIEGGIATFDGVDDAFRIPFSASDYAKLRRATLAVKFRFRAFAKKNVAIFSNTEMGGLCFSINVQDRRLTFWASINGTYRIVGVPIAPSDDFVDAFGTFDGEKIVVYLNGKEVAREAAVGDLTHPKDASARAFCVGADVASGGASNFFNGSVARARLFNWALTAEQVANLAKE